MGHYRTKSRIVIPPATLVAGIDLSRDHLVVVVLDLSGRIVDRFTVANQRAGYVQLRERLQRQTLRDRASGVIVAMEPTNYYWKQVGYDLEQHQMPFRLVNALTVKRHREGDQLERSKDDWRDAYTIADLLRIGKCTETQLPHGIYAELQTGYTAYWRLRQDRGRQLTLLRLSLQQLFPEFEQVFHNLTGATALAALRAGVEPHELAHLSEAEFRARVRALFEGQRLERKALRRLQAAASGSQGLPEARSALSWMVRQQAETLHLLDHQAAQLLAHLNAQFLRLPEAPYVLSIQGMTVTLAMSLIAMIGEVRCYPAGASLVKLAGTQPTPHRSGLKSYSPTPFSHQGRSGLRTALYFATLHLLHTNRALRYQYQRLLERESNPLPKMQAVGACMNKLLWYVWHLVTYQEHYDPDYWQHRGSA